MGRSRPPALRELGLTPTHRTPDPNTWREVLAIFDRHVPPVNRTVALIEYGQANASLLAGLEARGATVRPLKVYRWELPEDLGPLEANVRAIAAGEIDVALFTSSQQATNLLTIAARMGLAEQVRGGLAQAVVGSIGPDTSETLRQHELPIDFEPEHSAMGHLVAAAADRAGGLLASKRGADGDGCAAESVQPTAAPEHSQAEPRGKTARS